MKYAQKTSAVSPIVATLVLIVVAVVGAVAVGTIMGTFSSDVAKQTNTGDVASSASTEILTVGSTSVQPVSEALAEQYMKDHTGIKITVQGGGSGAGRAAAGMGIADLGASSASIPSTECAQWPDLQAHRIGGSAVVIIASSALTGSGTPLNTTAAELKTLYDATAGVTEDPNTNLTLANVKKVVQRAEESGTEETFAGFLNLGSNVDSAVADSGVTLVGASGNAGVLQAVQQASDAIGFVDMGFAFDTTGKVVSGIQIVGIDNYPATKDAMKNAVIDMFAGNTQKTTTYPQSLAKKLYYITNGAPNSVLKNYITWAQSPESDTIINGAGCFSLKTIGYANVKDLTEYC